MFAIAAGILLACLVLAYAPQLLAIVAGFVLVATILSSGPLAVEIVAGVFAFLGVAYVVGAMIGQNVKYRAELAAERAAGRIPAGNRITWIFWISYFALPILLLFLAVLRSHL